MCQLTYANLHDKTINSLVVYFLTTIGSNKHDDGTGFICSTNSYWKSALAADKIKNYGEILNKNIKDNSAIPAHIRMATAGIPVLEKNAHPFMAETYTIIHNGTLTDKGDARDKEESDSEMFLKALEDARKELKDSSFVDVFNKAMSGFTGKFAFIVKDRTHNVDYIVRGKQAELWICYVYKRGKKIKDNEYKHIPVGYFINTDKYTIEKALDAFSNVATIVTGDVYSYSEITLLQENSAFLAEPDSITLLGETKETPTPKKETMIPLPPLNRHQNLMPDRSQVQHKVQNTESLETLETLKMSGKIFDFLSDNSLTILDFQIMFHMASNCSLLEMNSDDAKFFIDFAIPKLSAPKGIRKKVKALTNAGGFPNSLYKKLGLIYPWTLNKDKFDVILAELQKGK